jgi:hypothetical protein
MDIERDIYGISYDTDEEFSVDSSNHSDHLGSYMMSGSARYVDIAKYARKYARVDEYVSI